MFLVHFPWRCLVRALLDCPPFVFGAFCIIHGQRRQPLGRCTFPVHGAGLRLAEALALRPADVNLDNGDIRVLHGKGDRAPTVGIDDGALVYLARWMDKRRTLGRRVSELIGGLAPTSPRRAGLDGLDGAPASRTNPSETPHLDGTARCAHRFAVLDPVATSRAGPGTGSGPECRGQNSEM